MAIKTSLVQYYINMTWINGDWYKYNKKNMLQNYLCILLVHKIKCGYEAYINKLYYNNSNICYTSSEATLS